MMPPELSNDSIKEIICNHVFYTLTIIFIGITVYHALPVESWKLAGTQITFLVFGSIVMAGLSLCSAIRCHIITKLANELRERLMEEEVEDEEKEC